LISTFARTGREIVRARTGRNGSFERSCAPSLMAMIDGASTQRPLRNSFRIPARQYCARCGPVTVSTSVVSDGNWIPS
jgi:hypothetical protein